VLARWLDQTQACVHSDGRASLSLIFRGSRDQGIVEAMSAAINTRHSFDPLWHSSSEDGRSAANGRRPRDEYESTACCDKMSFQRLNEPFADPGKAEGVEFTIGNCTNCKRFLVHCWVGGGISEGYRSSNRARVGFYESGRIRHPTRKQADGGALDLQRRETKLGDETA
jgi:hypothetical protein